MCGAIFNVSDFPLLEPLLEISGYEEADIRKILTKRELRPTDPVLTLVPTRSGLRLMPATWWLKLDANTLKPDTRWATFNCRSDHILTSKLHRIPPRSYRAIVAAEGFFEWQPIYSGGRLYSALTEAERSKPPRPIAKQRFLVSQPGHLLYFGALCKHWLDEEQQPRASVGIITLPPHPAFLDVHHKSFPLIIQPEELTPWMDSTRPHSDFSHLFALNQVRQSMEAVAVNEPEFEALEEAEPLVLKPVSTG
ncbi:MAG: SOS response-associated peptidase [Saccharospirillum sp.]|nr:SOS response-associated peptidase [Saccharospirillum sp.]